MSRAKLLSDLQELDLQRDEAVSRLTVIVKALKGNPAVAEAEKAVAEGEQALGDVERRVRLHDLDRQDVKDHISREEQKLYSGKVKAPKELESLQQEIDSLRRRLAGLDDTALDLMMEQDETTESLARAKDELSRIAADSASEVASMTEEKAGLTAVIRGLDARRAELVTDIDATDVALYERLRPKRGGRAVAPLKGEHCGVCGIQLPRTDLDAARAGQRLVQCTGCHRILLG
jgi:predicted  nucleic acid-binding Zn-ribbon protein